MKVMLSLNGCPDVFGIKKRNIYLFQIGLKRLNKYLYKNLEEKSQRSRDGPLSDVASYSDKSNSHIQFSLQESKLKVAFLVRAT